MDATTPTPSDGPTPDEPFDRLHAADPAAGTQPDTARLREAVTRAGGPGTTSSDAPVATGLTAVDGGPVPADELAAARRRRRPARWLQVAAAVAGIAVVGSGGFALGHRDAPHPAAASISLTGGSGSSESQVAPAAGGLAAATDRAMGSKMIAPWFGGRTVFTGAGLSTAGGSASAWSFDPAAVFSEETAARVAAALGVPGSPTLQGSSWTVGAQDGTGPNVQLQADGVTSVSYYDPTRDPWSCVRSAPDSPGTSGSAPGEAVPGAVVAPTAEPPAPPATLNPELDPSTGCAGTAAPAPSGDAAVGQARDAMSALGVDPSGYELEAQADVGTGTGRPVTAYQVLDDQRTGVVWSFTVVADGVQSLYGALAPVVELGAYDVVSPADAVARLTDPRFGASFGGGIMTAVEDGGAARTAVGTAETTQPDATAPTLPPTLAAGAAVRWPVEQVTLTTARLGLGMTTLPDGATVLLPSYELGAADGSSWSVVAVAEDRLDFAPAR